MFDGMMGKLQEMQQQMEDAKKRLSELTVIGEADNGRVKVVISGDKKIRELEIDDSLLADKEALQDLILVALNKGMENAEKLHETEMQGVAKFNFPGLDI